MAEVLSQNQIDELLNAVRSGEKPVSDSSENQQSYRKYDFSSPRKFTKDRIKMLNGIFDNYAHIINSRLNARLRANCEITVESIEEQRFYEFSNALTENDVLGLIDATVNGKLEDTPVMMYLSTQMALSMMDRMMGGESTAGAEVEIDYAYTDLELKLYEDIVQDMVAAMGGSWSGYLPIEFSFQKIDVNPTLNPIIGFDEIIVIVDMKIKFADISGRISICLPGDMLTNIFTEISRENPARRQQTENKADEIFESLRDSSLEIVAELGDARLSLSDVYHLHVGDVIDLGCSKNSPIRLGIGGYPWFTGRVGTHQKNVAIRIDEVVNETEQRSE